MARKPIQTKPGQDVVLIRALRGPRRRAGMRFTEMPVEVDAGALTEAQQQALADDPLLHVTRKSDPDDKDN